MVITVFRASAVLFFVFFSKPLIVPAGAGFDYGYVLAGSFSIFLAFFPTLIATGVADMAESMPHAHPKKKG